MGNDGRIRVHSSDGRLHCVTDSGEAAFSPVEVGEPLGWASPVVDRDNNTLVCAYGGGLLKIDPSGGRRGTPFFRSRQKFDCTGSVRDGVFYVGAEDGFIYAIRLEGSRGKNLWDHTAGRGKTDWFINSAPAQGPDGVLIVAGRDEYLYALGTDGARLWRLHLRGQMLASPVVDAGGDVYVGVSLEKLGRHGSGKLICINGESQRVRWEYHARASIESTPVIGSDGIIYFGDNAGTIHAVAPDGQTVWREDVGSPVRSAGAIAPERHLVFGTDDGSLVTLVCSSESVAPDGWPKYMGTPQNTAAAPG